ncbi:MAG: 3-methyl-2-oxobutanoate dehydrogenase subunit VorB [Candidatus Krumholzibacteriota bacterium]|nr:3-methyl-2-oxobutanoate dehydrogenase subunit VorB [Candidatus Krumholzibacteriota bacterium]
MAKEFIKGNEAIVKAALLAGCRSYYGYPITPASEIAHAAAKYFPRVSRTFLQAESEIASIQMVYGASASGERTMTASSGPGISLKQEGLSYLAGSELPCVVVNIMRGGPGLGNISPAQGDYNQIVKGGGHGDYKVIVLAPNGAQEMCDLTMLAFDLADKWRNPVILLADGFIGQMMEPVEFPAPVGDLPAKPWALTGEKISRNNLINSIYLDNDELEAHVGHLAEKYARITEAEVRFEAYHADDAELVLVGYGIVSRIIRTVVDQAREAGLKVGLLRPITLFPFPTRKIGELCESAAGFLAVEMSTGQMVDDVRLAVNGRLPVHFFSRTGGNVPTVEEIFDVVRQHLSAAQPV